MFLLCSSALSTWYKLNYQIISRRMLYWLSPKCYLKSVQTKKMQNWPEIHSVIIVWHFCNYNFLKQLALSSGFKKLTVGTIKQINQANKCWCFPFCINNNNSNSSEEIAAVLFSCFQWNTKNCTVFLSIRN